MTDAQVRPGGRGDLPYVLDLGRRVSGTSVSSVRADADPQHVEDAFDALVEFVVGRDHELVVAERDGRPIAFALAVYDVPDEVTLGPQAFLAYMAVEPEEQGRGIGRRLLALVEESARRRGFPTFALSVTEENAPARALYEGAGFTTERRIMAKRL